MTNIDNEEFLNLFSLWYRDGLRSLNFILGHAAYLTTQSDGLDNEHVKQSLEAILHYSHLAKNDWQNAWRFLVLSYGHVSPQWQAQQLHDVINRAISDTIADLSTSTVQIDITQNAPAIRGNQWLIQLVACFLYPPIDNHQPAHVIIEANHHSETALMVQVSWQTMPSSLSMLSEE